ncbi:MAG: hypothetical protein IJY65_00020 [Clostridia bacterium]|nr:hypothetical protein [Clostridia bacterium]
MASSGTEKDIFSADLSKSGFKQYESRGYYESNIKNDKNNVNVSFKECRRAAEKLISAYSAYATAKENYDIKPKARNLRRVENAKDNFDDAVSAYRLKLDFLNKHNAEVVARYEEYSEMLSRTSPRAASKVADKAQRYTFEYEEKRAQLNDMLAEIPLPEEKVKPEEEKRESSYGFESTSVGVGAPEQPSAPKTEVKPQSVFREYEEYRPQIRFAPVSLDISDKVERAVDFAIQKLTEALEEKIGEYAKGLNLPALESKACEGEKVAQPMADSDVQAVIEKTGALAEGVSALMARLDAMAADLSRISDSYQQIENKLREINEAQKQTNDMQRSTAREAQGVQVNQRLINQEQNDIAHEQALLREMQKGASEKQKILTEAQAQLLDSQKTVLETQATLEESMKTVMRTQRDIINTQQSIVAGNAKSIESQKELTALQTEAQNMQKEAASVQRQLIRDQRAIGEKQGEIADIQKALGAAVKDALKEQKTALKKAMPQQ